MSPAGRTSGATDAGFTMLELVVVMAIAGVLATIGMFGFASWQATAQQQGTADAVLSQLRNASTRAVSEGRTYCVELTGDAFAVYRYSCSATAPGEKVLGPRATQDATVTLAATVTHGTPAPACPAGSTCFYFRPRGTASKGSVVVSSTKRSKTYTINVEGLTARVYM